MWTHISLNVDIVWEDVLWREVAIWQDDDAGEPVALEKGGRVPLGADRTPEGALAVAIAAARSERGLEQLLAGEELGN
jgi:hypothetical protein